MKVSYNWLQNYLKIPVDLNSANDILTSIGLEVEGMTDLFSAFDHLVIGKVLECTVLVIIDAKAYSFHESKKANIAAAPIPGPARGNSTFQKA